MLSGIMSLILLSSGIFLSSLLLTGCIRYWGMKSRILDVPVSRSAHRQPTPYGGGLAVVIPVFAVSSYACRAGMLPDEFYLALCGAFAVALAGLLDDLWKLPVPARLSMQFLAAGWSLFWLGEVAPINLAGWELNQQWMLAALALPAMVWILNLYNFMDGIDGLAGSQMLFVSLAVLLLSLESRTTSLVLISLTLAAATAGFLLWNWAPARVFMGDVGSGFCGFTLGLLALFSMHGGSMTLWTWLVLMGVFVTDATLTLLRRAASGRRWYEGHSSHAYQHLARRYGSHARVTLLLMMTNCLWLAPLAWWTTRWPNGGMLICFVALAPLALTAVRLGAGTESTDGSGSQT